MSNLITTNINLPGFLLAMTVVSAGIFVVSNATSLGIIPVESFPLDNPEIPNPDGKLSKNMHFAKCITERHNYYREAVNLQPLKWNSTLAKLAYMTSKFFRNDSCSENHRTKFNNEHWVGENLFYQARFPFFYDYEKDVCVHATNAVDEWYKEIRYYVYPLPEGTAHHKCLPLEEFSKYGHFIQMMWQKGRKLGCSYASCMTDEFGYEMPKIIVNCYYDTPVLQGSKVFNKWVAKRLDELPINEKYGGLPTCEVGETL